MAVVSISNLLEAGVHFGHQTKRWNPKMKEYIFTTRDDIYIIDLQKTLACMEEAYAAISEIAKNGGTFLFVGTKKQAQEAALENATRSNSYYVTQRWLGGTLTNFRTIRRRVKRLEEIEKMEENGTFDVLPKKEVIQIKKEYEKLNNLLGGIREMTKLPQALIIVDPKKEYNAIREARKLNIPIFGIVDTNCDPDDVDYVIHCGDVVDGVSSFQDQLDNLRYYSFEMQSQYFIENYPEFGVPTIMVSGNHDGWWKNYTDKDIIKYISKNRDDIEYLGGSDGIFKVNDYTMLMMHGHKSNQKIFERYQDYDIDLAFRGHSHTHVVKYPDNIVHIPCLVNKRLHKGMENSFQELGVWWITIDLRDKLVYKRLELFSERPMKRSLIKERGKY